MIQIIFATNPLFFSSLRQTPKFNHIEGLIVGMLTLTLFEPIELDNLGKKFPESNIMLKGKSFFISLPKRKSISESVCLSVP